MPVPTRGGDRFRDNLMIALMCGALSAVAETFNMKWIAMFFVLTAVYFLAIHRSSE